MIGEKVRHYQGKNIDLNSLKSKIEDYLKNIGFRVQSSLSGPHGIVIQAQKGGFLRSVITADRALTIMIMGEPEDFTVRVGIGRWLKHLAVTAAEAILLSEMFLLVDVPETLWNLEVENRILKQIDSLVSEPVMAKWASWEISLHRLLREVVEANENIILYQVVFAGRYLSGNETFTLSINDAGNKPACHVMESVGRATNLWPGVK